MIRSQADMGDCDAQRRLTSATAALREYRTEMSRTDLLYGAIAGFESLVTELAVGEPVRLAALTNLSAALRDLYNLSPGDRAVLERATRLAQESVDLTSSDNRWYASRVNNLGVLIRERYQLDGVVDDLRTIVADQERILDNELAPLDQRAMISNNAAQGLRELYEISLDRRFLRRAHSRHRQAVRLARAGTNPDLPMILHHAGITTRIWRPTPDGCRAAIELQHESIQLTEPSSVYLPSRRASLARALLSLSQAVKGPEALSSVETAEAEYIDILQGVPEDSPQAAIPLLGLAEATERRLELTALLASSTALPIDADRDTMAAYDRALTAHEASSPISALSSAWGGARSSLRAGDEVIALQFLQRGLLMAEQLLTRQMQRIDQRSWQLHSERLAPAAAVLHVRRGDPVAAANILDASRARESWVLQRAAANSDRSTAAHSWLDAGGPHGNAAIDAAQFSAPIGPSLRSPSTAPSEAHQTVAYLVPSEMGGAVIVLRSDGSVASRKLDRLTTSAVSRQQRRLARHYANRRAAPAKFETALVNVGRWLASAVVRAMLRLSTGSGPLVVVPCGPLADLPLMTAWEPRSTGGRRYLLLERGALVAMGARPAVPTFKLKASARVLVVQDQRSSVRPFESVTGEILNGRVVTQSENTADTADVITALEDCDIIHVSCHGTASRTDSADSAIHLSPTVDLRAGDILRARLHEHQIVFLASCEAGSADPRLPDQTFGPPAAFLHAGAGTVIAPLLAVQVIPSTLLAARFHAELPADRTPYRALTRAQLWIAESTAVQRLEFFTTCMEQLEREGKRPEFTRRLVQALARATARDPAAAAPLADWCLFVAQI